MNGSPIKRPLVRREPSTPRKIQKTVDLLTPASTPGGKQFKEEIDRENLNLNLFPAAESAEAMPVVASGGQSDCVTENTGPYESIESHRSETLKSNMSLYAQAKALFQRGSKIREVVGRAEERAILLDKIEKCIKHRRSGAVYVSGLPGTGKSALIGEILKRSTFCQNPTIAIAQLNCMTIDRADQTYGVIAKEFGFLDRRSNKTKTQCVELLQHEFTLKNRTHILVLDELDRIVTSDQEVLFRIFEWACGATNLLVIGIANAIDLTDRFLPRLQAHQLRPEVVAFKPYTAQGISAIIESRLKLLPQRLMHPAAVKICAAKTAANSGDLRKAFDICRRSIEVVEEELLRIQADDAPENSALKIVTTSHVASVCNIAFGGIDARKRLEGLNFQQRAVLCVLMKTERNTTNANVTVAQAFQEYEERCTHHAVIKSLSYTEYVEVVNTLESAGLVAVTGLCGKKGLGSHGSNRVSRGGGGAAGNKGSKGYRDEFGLRKISSRAQVLDVLRDLANNDPLRAILAH